MQQSIATREKIEKGDTQMKKEKIRPTPVAGTGWYRYKNVAGADLVLPKPLPNGRNLVPRDGFFDADSSYQNIYGIKLMANLMPPEPAVVIKETVQEPIPKAELIIDVAPATLEFFEPTGVPINECSIKKNEERPIVEITKKELVEFATLKGIAINPNWSKERIMEKIRNNSGQ